MTWGVYAAVMAVSALAAPNLPLTRRVGTCLCCAGYAGAALTLASSHSAPVHIVAPPLFLLLGYWLSGLFVRDWQTNVERRLLHVDARILEALRVPLRLRAMPRLILELLEAAYAADYLVVGGGAVLVWSAGRDAVAQYWAIVLAAELTCYATLPWIRTRPPRALEPATAMDARRLWWRRLNLMVLGSASVQANTLPSGHVAGAVAAAAAVLTVWPAAGAGLAVVAALIAIAAFIGRYHYFVDVVSGAVVGVAVAIWA